MHRAKRPVIPAATLCTRAATLCTRTATLCTRTATLCTQGKVAAAAKGRSTSEPVARASAAEAQAACA